ncbi:M15 family metallopeptidase [Schlegelella aquatica]|uniref:M15 family metallopeptidase n=1 Tax=Caldimonas aquatica TaxID=376175 RepID=UPI0037503103
MSLAAALVSYLVIVALAGALLALPEARDAARAWVGRCAVQGRWAVRQATTGLMRMRGAASQWARLRERLHAWGPREWGWLAGGLLVVCLPPLLAYWLGSHRMLDGFGDWGERPVDRQIAALLEGEHLVPPPPLPPEVFATREVEAERPMLAFASREWALLDADFQQRLLLVFKIMRERHGYEMVLLEGYRSPERQEMLRHKGGHVTHAGAYQSYHQFGLAADCAFLRDGKLVISEKDPWAAKGYQLYGEMAEAVGLTWGGRWKSIVDLGHVELRRPGVKKATRPPGA